MSVCSDKVGGADGRDQDPSPRSGAAAVSRQPSSRPSSGSTDGPIRTSVVPARRPADARIARREDHSMRRVGNLLKVLVALVAALLAVAACSSQGGAQDNSSSGQKYTIAMITHESPGDTFWDKIRAGAEQAAKDHGIDLKYSNDPDAGKQATLIQNAVDSKVDGIAVTLAFPDAVGPAAKSALDGGIPVVAFNSGIGNYQQFGIPMYFGSNEDLAGQTVGKRIGQEGGGKALCVIQEQ